MKDYVRERRLRRREMFVPLSHPPGHAQAGRARLRVAPCANAERSRVGGSLLTHRGTRAAGTAGVRSGAVLEAPAFVAGLDNLAMMKGLGLFPAVEVCTARYARFWPPAQAVCCRGAATAPHPQRRAWLKPLEILGLPVRTRGGARGFNIRQKAVSVALTAVDIVPCLSVERYYRGGTEHEREKIRSAHGAQN